MTEDQRKHLEFIQNIITRMNTNSFQIKGWVVTLVSALFALAATSQSHATNVLTIIAMAPIIPFWVLDGFFLSRERKFRVLYEKLIEEKTPVPAYSMQINEFDSGKGKWVVGIFSKTLLVFYLSVLGIAGAAAIFVIRHNPN